MRKPMIMPAAGASMGLSTIASALALCCFSPWVVVLFGISGAIAFARLAPLRPYLLAGAALGLAWALWRVMWLRRHADGGICRTPSRSSLLLISLSGILLLLALIAPMVERLLEHYLLS